MFISVLEGLPKTSYMKMVEVWLIFNLLLPFSDVLLHTYTDHIRLNILCLFLTFIYWYLRSAVDDTREVNHHGTVVTVGQDSEDEKEAGRMIRIFSQKMREPRMLLTRCKLTTQLQGPL